MHPFVVTNRISQTCQLRLFTIQIGWENAKIKDNNTSLSDDSSGDAKTSATRLKFEYITEVAPKISNFRADKMKPGYLNILPSSDNEDPAFYIYTGVGVHQVVYKQTLA